MRILLRALSASMFMGLMAVAGCGDEDTSSTGGTPTGPGAGGTGGAGPSSSSHTASSTTSSTASGGGEGGTGGVAVGGTGGVAVGGTGGTGGVAVGGTGGTGGVAVGGTGGVAVGGTGGVAVGGFGGAGNCVDDGTCDVVAGEGCGCTDCVGSAECGACDNDATCEATDACTCVECFFDSYCSSPTCTDDGICNGYLEGCNCADCANEANCAMWEDCDNGVDDDADGQIDCADPLCAAVQSCIVPAAWDCNPFYYDEEGQGNTPFCDCSCGAHDPDCDIVPTPDLFCGGADGAGQTCTNDVCSPPAGWTCPASTYDEEGQAAPQVNCHCECGAVDPDCADAGVPVVGCQAGEVCGPSGTCQLAVPANWNCNPIFFQDGDCDCGCGAFDVDCPNATLAVCVYCNDTGSCSTLDCLNNPDINPNDNAICL